MPHLWKYLQSGWTWRQDKTHILGTPSEHPPSTHPHAPPLLVELSTSGPQTLWAGYEGHGGAHLSGVRLFPFSFTSRSSSEESTGEVVLASRSSCSCWARYWAGFCLASLAQCSSSRCSRGRLACKSIAHIKRAACKQFQQRRRRKISNQRKACSCHHPQLGLLWLAAWKQATSKSGYSCTKYAWKDRSLLKM